MMCTLAVFVVVAVGLLGDGGRCGQTSGKSATIGAAGSCTCGGLTCNCCVSLDAQIVNPSSGCLKATYVPNDLTLNIEIEADGRPVYTTKIDPGNFPICAPIFPPACLAFNRIHVDEDGPQFCAEIRLGPVTLQKLPWFRYSGGNLVVIQNTF